MNRRTFLTGTAASVATSRLLRAAPVITAAGLATPSTAEAASLPLPICRCATYGRVRQAIKNAAAAMP